MCAEEQIAAIRSDWCKYLHSKQLEPEMNLYAEDAVFLQPTGERVSGLPAIRKLFVAVMGMVTSEPVLMSVNLDISDNLAYDSGVYRETLTDVATGAKTQARGSYLMVLKRRARRQMANSAADVEPGAIGRDHEPQGTSEAENEYLMCGAIRC